MTQRQAVPGIFSKNNQPQPLPIPIAQAMSFGLQQFMQANSQQVNVPQINQTMSFGLQQFVQANSQSQNMQNPFDILQQSLQQREDSLQVPAAIDRVFSFNREESVQMNKMPPKHEPHKNILAKSVSQRSEDIRRQLRDLRNTIQQSKLSNKQSEKYRLDKYMFQPVYDDIQSAVQQVWLAQKQIKWRESTVPSAQRQVKQAINFLQSTIYCLKKNMIEFQIVRRPKKNNNGTTASQRLVEKMKDRMIKAKLDTYCLQKQAEQLMKAIAQVQKTPQKVQKKKRQITMPKVSNKQQQKYMFCKKKMLKMLHPIIQLRDSDRPLIELATLQ